MSENRCSSTAKEIQPPLRRSNSWLDDKNEWRRKKLEELDNKQEKTRALKGTTGFSRTLSSPHIERKKLSDSDVPNTRQNQTEGYHTSSENRARLLATVSENVDGVKIASVPNGKVPKLPSNRIPNGEYENEKGRRSVERMDVSLSPSTSPTACQNKSTRSEKEVQLVKITRRVSKNRYYVVKDEDIHLIEEINRSPRKRQFCKDQLHNRFLYLFVLDGYGYRVKVIDKEPLTLYYVDTGHREVFNESRTPEYIGSLPSESRRMKPLAFKIELWPNPTRELEEESYIKISKHIAFDLWELVQSDVPMSETLSTEPCTRQNQTEGCHSPSENHPRLLATMNRDVDHAKIASVPNGVVPKLASNGIPNGEYENEVGRRSVERMDVSLSPSTSPTACQNKSTRSENEVQLVKITRRVSKNRYFVVKHEDTHLLEEIHSLPRKRQFCKDQLHNRFLYVSEYDGYDYRVKVIEKQPLTLYYVDTGHTEVFNESRTPVYIGLLPHEFIKIKALAFKIILSPTPTAELEEWSYVKIKNIANDQWELIVSDVPMSETISADPNTRQKQTKGCYHPSENHSRLHATVGEEVDGAKIASVPNGVIPKLSSNHVPDRKYENEEGRRSVEKMNVSLSPSKSLSAYQKKSTRSEKEAQLVKITHRVSKNNYYVVKDEDIHLLEEINRSPRERQFCKDQLHNGFLYLSVLDGYGYRVRVIKNDPVTLFYIDTGYHEKFTGGRRSTFIGLLPYEFRLMKPLAFKVELLPDLTVEPEEGSYIRIKHLVQDLWKLVQSNVPKSETISASRETPEDDAWNGCTLEDEAEKNDCDSLGVVHKVVNTDPRSDDEKYEKGTLGKRISTPFRYGASNPAEEKEKDAREEQMKTKAAVARNTISADSMADKAPTSFNGQEEEKRRHQTVTLKSMLSATPKKAIENDTPTCDWDDSVIVQCTPAPSLGPVVNGASPPEAEAKAEVDALPTERGRDSPADVSELSCSVHESRNESTVAVPEQKDVSSSALVVGKPAIVAVVGEGVFFFGLGKDLRDVYAVIRPKMLSAYRKMLENLQTEGEMFESCAGVYEVGKLYALKGDDDGSFRRVKVFYDCPSMMECVDDGRTTEGSTNEEKLWVHVFDVDNLFKLPSEYIEDDLVPFWITTETPTKLTIGSEVVIVPKEERTHEPSGSVWFVDLVKDEDGEQDSKCDDWDDSVEEVAIVQSAKSVVAEEEVDDVILEVDIEPDVSIYVSITGFDDGSTYKVVLSKKREEYDQLLREMLIEGQSFAKLRGEFRMENLYAIRRDERLHRVQVKFADPPTLLFVENGRVDQFSVDELLVLPNKYKRSDSIPFSITFEKNLESLKPDVTIWINPVEKIHPNHWFVYLDSHLDPLGPELQCSLPAWIANLEFTAEQLNENEEATFVPILTFGKNYYSGFLVSKTLRKTISSMNKQLMNIPPDPDYRPKSGEMVVAVVVNSSVLNDDGTNNMRALILHEPTPLHPVYTVFCIDHGLVEECAEVAPIPSQLSRIPAISAMCTIERAPDDEEQQVVQKGEIYTVVVKESRPEGRCAAVLVEQACSSSPFEMVFEKCWPPRGDTVDHVPVNTGDRVKLLRFKASSKCCIVPSGQDILDQVNEMLLHVKMKASKTPPKEDPLLFDVIAVPYKDCLQRAKVVKKLEDDLFLVKLMDKNKELSVRREHMRTIPQYLQRMFCTAVPIKLKGVHVGEVDERKHKDLVKFFEYQYDLKLEIEDDGSVTLKFLPDVNYDPAYTAAFATLNEYLESCFTPFWLACLGMFEPEVVRYEETSVEERDWIVGRRLSLLVTDVNSQQSSVFVCNLNGRGQRRYDEMEVENRLQEYGERVTKSYCPAAGEVCIAKSAKKRLWGRAVCYEAVSGMPLKMQFLDFGHSETVEHTRVRQMPGEFVKYPVLTIEAVVGNVDRSDLPKLEAGVRYTFKITNSFLPTNIEVELLYTDDSNEDTDQE